MLHTRRIARRQVGCAFFAVLAGLVFSAPLFAQQPLEGEQEQLWQRYTEQQAELTNLRAQVSAQPGNATFPVANANFEALPLETAAVEKDKAKAADAGYEIGSDLKMKARWDINNGLIVETPNKDFVSHFGIRTQ